MTFYNILVLPLACYKQHVLRFITRIFCLRNIVTEIIEKNGIWMDLELFEARVRRIMNIAFKMV
jgi:hypothetical protein